MQNNNREKKSETALDTNGLSQAASLELIAGVFAVLAQSFGTIAAVTALQEAQELANANTNNADLQKIQKELQYLTREMKKITKGLNL